MASGRPGEAQADGKGECQGSQEKGIDRDQKRCKRHYSLTTFLPAATRTFSVSGPVCLVTWG